MTEKTIYIAPYTRTDGTQVRGHYRHINTDGLMTFNGDYGDFDPNENPIPDFWFDPSRMPEKKGPTFPDEGSEPQDGEPTGWEPPIFVDKDDPTGGTTTPDRTPQGAQMPDGTSQGGQTGSGTPQGGQTGGDGSPQDGGQGGSTAGDILLFVLQLTLTAAKYYAQYKIAQIQSEAEAAKHLKPILVQHVKKLNETNIQLKKLEQKKIEQLTSEKLSKAEYKKLYSEVEELHKQNAKNTEFVNKLSYHVKNDNTDEGIQVLNEYIRTQKPVQMPENHVKIAFAPSEVTTHYTPPKPQTYAGGIENAAPRPFPQLSVPMLQGGVSMNVNSYNTSQPQQNLPIRHYNMNLQYSPISFLPEIYRMMILGNYKSLKAEDVTSYKYNKDKYGYFVAHASKYNWGKNKNSRSETGLLMDLALKYNEFIKPFVYNNNYIVIPPYYNNIIATYYNISISQKQYGVIFDKHSSLSKKLSNDSQLQCQVFLTYKDDKFKSGRVSIDLIKNPDLHYSIGHATILQPRIDSDGYFRGVLYDKYDFNWLPLKDTDFYTFRINNVAYILQLLGLIHNYYILVPIEFKWEPSMFVFKYIQEHNEK